MTSLNKLQTCCGVLWLFSCSGWTCVICDSCAALKLHQDEKQNFHVFDEPLSPKSLRRITKYTILRSKKGALLHWAWQNLPWRHCSHDGAGFTWTLFELAITITTMCRVTAWSLLLDVPITLGKNDFIAGTFPRNADRREERRYFACQGGSVFWTKGGTLLVALKVPHLAVVTRKAWSVWRRN